MTNKQDPPHTQITIAEQEVKDQGFTASGQNSFCETVIDYGNTLLKRSCEKGSRKGVESV